MGKLWMRVSAVVVLLVAVAPLGPSPASADTGPTVMSETFQIGPFDLAPRGQAGDQVNRLFEDAPRPPGDLAIRSITWDFVDDNGTTIPGDVAHLHHIVLLDSARPDQLCSFPSQSRFASTGKEMNDLVLPDGYAYHAPEAPWSSVYHVMNMSDEPIQAAIEYTIHWTDASEGGFLDVEPYFFDVTGCWGNSEYQVPGDGGPDSVHEQSRTYVIDRDGVAVAGGGHLHAGGIDITMVRDGDELCRSEAVYGTGGHGGHHSLEDVTPCGFLAEPLEVGDEIELVARYRNDAPISGAMGIMVTYVHHTGPPPPEPTLDITGVALVDGALTGELVCNRPLEVWLDGFVTQDKGGPAIGMSGYLEEPVTCGTDPVPFVLDLLWANGSLTGGSATYSVYGWASDGADHVSAEATGETQVRGRIDPAMLDAEDGGPLPITLDRRNAAPATVSGTVTCATPTEIFVSADASQKVGRHLVDGYGSTSVACDGATNFVIPLESYLGRLVSGPLDVRVTAYDLFGWEPSVTSGTVIAAGPPATGDLADSPLQVTDAVAAPGGVEVLVTHPGCPAGAEYELGISARDGKARGGPRLTDGTGNVGEYLFGSCDGDALSVPVFLPTGDDTRSVQFSASLSWYDDERFGSDENAGVLAVDRR